MVCRSDPGGEHIKGYPESAKPVRAGEETIYVPQQLASHSGQPHPGLGAPA